MKTLIIAEKKSAGKLIAKFLGTFEDNVSYLENDKYVISWAVGHVIDLAEPKEYGWTTSHLDQLPFFPDEIIFVPSEFEHAKKQLDILKSLVTRADVNCIINACDPDREGEAIFRRIQAYLKINKSVYRLWVASLTDKALKTAFENLKHEDEFEGLAAAGQARAIDDWLVGMNLSRAYSNLNITSSYPSIGRVQTPTLKLVVDREKDIKNFVSKPFWTVVAQTNDFTAKTDRFDTYDEAQFVANKLANKKATVVFYEAKDGKTSAPQLYSTTTLQMDASKYFGLTPAETDEALQNLYLAKLCSYPRTSSKYITEADLADFKSLYNKVASMPSFEGLNCTIDTFDKVVNDKKVEGHTALLPTENVDVSKFEEISDNEKRILTLLCMRVLISVSRDAEFTTHSIELSAEDEKLSCSVKQVNNPGFTSLLNELKTRFSLQEDKDGEKTDNEATKPYFATPVFGKQYDIVSTDIKEGKTKAPKPYTDASLLSSMEHAARLVDNKSLKDALSGSDVHPQGIGTPATRAEIIEKLVSRKYIKRVKKTLRATDEGIALINGVDSELTSPVLTAEMETELSAIEKSTMSIEEHVNHIKAMITRVINSINESSPAPSKVIGVCPKCGGRVVASKATYHCEHKKTQKTDAGKFVDVGSCDFFIFKKFFDYSITDDKAKMLLEGKTLQRKTKSKNGKPYIQELTLVQQPDESYRVEATSSKKK